MTIPEKALAWALQIASDQSHGYSQQVRWGPDFDCSSFSISAYKTGAGLPIDTSIVNFTGNLQQLTRYGFKDVSGSVNFNTGSGLQKGDILYYHISGTNGHAAIYAGNGKIVHARGQSYGSSKTGDQGTEIAVTSYYRGKWQHVLRYTGTGAAASAAKPAKKKRYAVNTTMPVIKYGSTGKAVKVWQMILGVDPDGEFGPITRTATIQLQKSAGLLQDAEVGSATWAAGLKTLE